MPEEKAKISIEKLITGSDEKETAAKVEKVEKPITVPEKEVRIEELKNTEKVEVAQEGKLERGESKEGEGELGGIVSLSNEQQHSAQQIKEIEDIMANDLKEVFLKMPPEKRVEFKRVGEETAVKIYKLMDKTKIKVRKIIRLLRKWLALIPGANKYFLEQKVKIKADRIIALKDKGGDKDKDNNI